MEIKDLIQDTIAQMERLSKNKISNTSNSSDEKEFLEFISSRVELFLQGLKSEALENSEDKLEIVLEFLEFLSQTTNKRLEKIV